MDRKTPRLHCILACGVTEDKQWSIDNHFSYRAAFFLCSFKLLESKLHLSRAFWEIVSMPMIPNGTRHIDQGLTYNYYADGMWVLLEPI